MLFGYCNLAYFLLEQRRIIMLAGNAIANLGIEKHVWSNLTTLKLEENSKGVLPNLMGTKTQLHNASETPQIPYCQITKR